MVCSSRIASTCDNSSCVVSRTWSGAASSHALTFSFEPIGPPSYRGKRRQAAFPDCVSAVRAGAEPDQRSGLNRRTPRTPQAKRLRTSSSEVYPCLATIADVARCISPASLRHSIIIYRTLYRRPSTAAVTERYFPRRYSFTRSQKTASSSGVISSSRSKFSAKCASVPSWRCRSMALQ